MSRHPPPSRQQPSRRPRRRPAEGRAASPPLPTAKKIATQPPAIRKPAVRSPSQSQASESESSDLPDIGVPKSFRSTVAHHPKRKKSGDRNSLWIALGLGAGGLVLLTVFVVALMFIGNPKTKTKDVAHKKPAKEKVVEKDKEVLPIKSPPPGTPMLEFVWNESEREGATVTVDGREIPLPKTGKVKYPLPPCDEQYHFHIERPGFKPVEFGRRSEKGEEQLPYEIGNSMGEVAPRLRRLAARLRRGQAAWPPRTTSRY